MTKARDIANYTATQTQINSNGLTLLNTTSFTSQTAISIDNVFSSSYNNYRIMLRVYAASGTANLIIRGRNGSGNQNGSWYTGLMGSGYNPGSNYLTGINAQFGTVGGVTNGQGNRTYAVIDVLEPFSANATMLSVNGFYPDTALNGYSMELMGTSYTGFTIGPDGGNITGVLSVYGYRK